MSPWVTDDAPDAILHLKAVPGARQDQIVGPLGSRLKVRVSAPPEGGKANDAIRRLIADALGLKHNQVTLERGNASAEKTLRLSNISAAAVERALNSDRSPGPDA